MRALAAVILRPLEICCKILNCDTRLRNSDCDCNSSLDVGSVIPDSEEDEEKQDQYADLQAFDKKSASKLSPSKPTCKLPTPLQDEKSATTAASLASVCCTIQALSPGFGRRWCHTCVRVHHYKTTCTDEAGAEQNGDSSFTPKMRRKSSSRDDVSGLAGLKFAASGTRFKSCCKLFFLLRIEEF